MSIIEYHKGRTNITGDYNDRIIVEFEENIPDELFQTLDTLIATKKTKWLKNGAIPTDTVRDLFRSQGIMEKFHNSKKESK